MDKNIKPELPGGFQDYLPADQNKRNQMINTIRKTFELFGFEPLDTPAIEKKEVLTGSDLEFNKQIFGVSLTEKNKNKLALRFDLTVPLARVISAYPQDIKKPTKLYRFGRVWRGEKPQTGRFREFIQCDADIIGSDSVLADAESIALAYYVMKNLGVENFLIKINNRKILNGLYEEINFDKEKTSTIFRLIDKLEKIGWENITKELKEKGLNNNQISKINEFISIKGDEKYENCQKAKDFIKNSKEGKEGIQELIQLISILGIMEVPSEAWCIDFSVVRGLDYYTGIVFETILKNNRGIESVLGGGRYNNLIKRFSNNTIPAVGFSIGFDRLYTAMKDNFNSSEVPSNIMVLNFEKSAEEKVIEITSKLRNKNIPTDIYIGDDNSLKGQLSYAVSKNIKAVIIIGKKELEDKTISIKNLSSGEQQKIYYDDLEKEVKKIIG